MSAIDVNMDMEEEGQNQLSSPVHATGPTTSSSRKRITSKQSNQSDNPRTVSDYRPVESDVEMGAVATAADVEAGRESADKGVDPGEVEDGDGDGDGDFCLRNVVTHPWFKRIVYIVLLMLYVAYLSVALYLHAERAMPLVVITCLGLLILMYKLVAMFCTTPAWFVQLQTQASEIGQSYPKTVVGIIVGCIAILFIVMCYDEPIRFVSVFGLCTFIGGCYAFSYSRKDVKWKPVIAGLVLQIVLGVFIMRTSVGYELFEAIGNGVSIFLNFSDVGVQFLFGDKFVDHYFAFKVLPTIIFFSAFISVCYHLGILQVIITKLSAMMHYTMGTSASESLNAAGNIFVGQTEAPLLVAPFILEMTKSELHAVMTGGFATISGGVLVAYISFGVSPSALISASVMSAPAALAISKLLYPETEVSATEHGDEKVEINLPKYSSVVEAASKGASDAISLVANVGAMLIAFLSLVAFLDFLLSYFGSMIDHPEWSFKLFCSYLFVPFAWLMGVDTKDCQAVAGMLGEKTFINEFVAYLSLSEFINNRKLDNGGPTLTLRSEVIATYALCGFANVGSIGIQLGGLTPLAPTRAKDIASLGVRSMIAGTVACFMTACLAGVLYDEHRV